jgi:hypothetical protein
MAISKAATRTIYHIENGPASLYHVDANHALRFKDEWSATPWKSNGEKAEPIVEIPADWQDQSAHQRIGLAVNLGAERKGLTASKDDDFILEEIERRENAPAEEPVKEPAV